MRTTINLPDDVYEIARSLASAKRISLGQALAELVRHEYLSRSRVQTASGFPSFSVNEDAGPLTLQQTLEAEDDL